MFRSDAIATWIAMTRYIIFRIYQREGVYKCVVYKLYIVYYATPYYRLYIDPVEPGDNESVSE